MIQINDRWHIDTDPRNYILMETHNVVDRQTGIPTGKSSTTIYGFYPDMPRCLKAIARQESLDMIGSGNITLREAINRIEEIERDVYDRFVDADGRC